MALSRNERFNPAGHDTLSPAYSHISRVPISPTSTLICIAGQVGHDSATETTPSTLAEQCSVAFANVDKCLAAVGATKEDIVKITQYVVDILGEENQKGVDPERTKRYMEWMGGLTPPSTVVGVAALAAKGLLYEIEVVAVLSGAK